MFYFEEINGKKILKSDMLKDLNHAFTTRETVLKSAEKEVFDLIEQNKKDLCAYLNIRSQDLISPTQTHSTNIAISKPGVCTYEQTDALILANPEQAVYLNFADCTPVIIFDPVNNVASIAHAGWRGTAGKIAVKTIEKMSAGFGSEPKNLVCAIGPSIGACCYCVGEDVYSELKQSIGGDYGCFHPKDGKIFADLKKINYQQLLACGVKKIDLCNYCTSCSNELFFSYRKENGTTSRHSAVIKLKER